MHHQAIYDIAALCSKKGLDQVVLCPGSRCAPLTLAFARHRSFTIRTFSDERSAAFIAAGLATQTKKPCILICTSGTAAYNFAPAIAECYFNNIPLIVFTADRPGEWIGQQDGQTIYQNDIFGKHVKKSFELPQQYTHHDDEWAINRIVNEAVNAACEEPRGPVHINAPFREPLYPKKGESIYYKESIRVIDSIANAFDLNNNLQQQLLTEWSAFHNILIVCGQQPQHQEVLKELDTFSTRYSVPIVGDILSNLHGHDHTVRHADAFLGQASDDVMRSLRPDLLITFGRSVISKNLKLFLRKYTPKEHWHIQPAGSAPDTFQHMTKIVRTTPLAFFQLLNSGKQLENFEGQKQHNYFKLWEIEERRATRALSDFFPREEPGEFELVKEILDNLPPTGNLHLANSMSVRYANFIGLNKNQSGIEVFSNRGTSGIDGCTSTAVGHSLASEKLNLLITGDQAFFYDRNAFWHNYPLPNLRIVLLNNHGGAIFTMIDGPAALPEAIPYFVTEQRLNARKLCEEFGFEYLKLDNKRKVKNLIKNFFEADATTKILEIETDAVSGKNTFDQFKEQIRKSYEL